MPLKVTLTGKKLEDIKKSAKQVLNDAPRAVGDLAVNHFKQNFRKGGFDNNGVETWAGRKNRSNQGRGVLIKTGHLRNSIRVIKYNRDGVRVGSPEKYAQIHNEGGTIHHPGGTPFFIKDNKAIFVKKSTAERFQSIYHSLMPVTKPHDIDIPQRKFMGESISLNKKITEWLVKRFNTLINK